jgi:hypothetical protein
MVVIEFGILIVSILPQFVNALLPIVVTESGISIVAKLTQPANVLSLMEVILVPIDTVLKALHLSKTPFPIVVTELGISIDVRLLHPLKAQSPIVVTESGISIVVIPKQLANELSPIFCMVLGITEFLLPITMVFADVLIKQLQPSLESYTVFAVDTDIVDKAVAYLKASELIKVTPLPKITVSKSLQFKNEHDSIVLTESGISINAKLLQL